MVNSPLIKERLVDQLIRHSFSTFIASQFIAFLVFLTLLPYTEKEFITSWIVAFTSVTIVRYVNLIISKRNLIQGNIERIANYHTLGALFGGITWSVLILAYDAAQPLFPQLLIILVISGMPAASLASNAVYFPTFVAFALPILGSLIIWVLFFSTNLESEFAVVLAVYTALILFIARQYGANIRNTIEREEENKILVREIRAANAKLLQLAYKDPLTNLSNRRQFEENAAQWMEQLSGSSFSLALMLVDVDNFKQVNDTFGHEAGDELLKEISNRIRSASRESEMIAQVEVARIGGDEFIIVYHLDASARGLDKLSRRILHEITQPTMLADRSFTPSVSIGIALAPAHASKIKDLVRVADVAMYQAKKAGGNRVEIASDDTTTILG